MTADDDRTLTPSLRRRVVLTTIAVLAVLLAILGVTIDLTVGAQARRDLHDRLMATAARADALIAAGTTPDDVVAELDGGGIRVRLIRGDGTSYGDTSLPADPPDGDVDPPPPPPPPNAEAPPRPPVAGAPPPPVGPPPRPPDSTATAVRHRLVDGSTLVLVANTTAITTLLRQLRTVVVASSIAVLLIAAAGLTIVVHVAMSPLRRLTAVAASITSGDRGRRLRPDRPHTELGRAATALDAMLDALEDSESRAHRAAQDAERANAATRRFLADAAHELRTPIAGIHAGAERIAAEAIQRPDDPVDEAQRHRAELVLTEARRAGRLVADMLDLGRIDAGVPLDLRDCDLVAVVEDERARSALLAPAITMTRTGERTLAVRVDPLRVGQIVANLADNARRHTPAGGSITFDVGSRDGMAIVTVTDTGDGVPDGARDNIFERLVRLDDARARDHGGAGLGLPIARALARAHGGDVTCPSHQPGARFLVTLPLPR